MSEQPEPRLRPAEVAPLLGVSVRTVQAMAASGELPGAMKVDGEWKFSEAKVRAWIKRMERKNERSYAQQARDARAKKAASVARAAEKMIGTDLIISGAMPWPESGCGIYFLFVAGSIMYVGQAVNVVARIAQHGCTRKFDAWFWIPCRRNRLDHLERAYINALMPPWNRDPVTVKQRAAGV